MLKNEIIQILKEIPLFKALSEEHLLKISNEFNINKLKKGKTIFYQEDESTDLYIVLEGAVKACLIDPEGKETYAKIFLKKGDFFWRTESS